MRASCLRWAALMFVAGCGGETDAAPPEELIANVCSDAVQLPCWRDGTLSECQADLHELRAQGADDACTAQFDTWMRCNASFPVFCVTAERAAIAPECSALRDAHENCVDGDNDPPPPGIPPSSGGAGGSGGVAGTGGAGGSGGDQLCTVGFGQGPNGGVGCKHECPSHAAMCEGPTQFGPLSCTCTAGPQTGRAFEAADCSSGMISASDEQCGSP